MSYNPNIHHRRSIRLKGYDYSQAGLYFITICCENRECRFGKIENNNMILNDAGKIANEYWLEIPKHFPNTVLHEHIVMPNHIHGIIELTNENNIGVQNVGVQNIEPLPNNTAHTVGAENILPQHKFQKIIPHSIGSIVKGFKIGVTKWFRYNPQHHIEAENIIPQQPTIRIWQRNYYEHIIRNEQSYQTISNYIINNPVKWNDDKFYNQ